MKKFFLLGLVGLLFGCGGDQEKLVKIKTQFGDMTVLLYDETPKHKANFLKLAESGQYDSTVFHRVIQGFMIQGGDIYKGVPNAEPESERIDAEIVDKFFHKKGELAAARQGDQINPEKKSSGSQFYIVQGRVWKEEELTVDQLQLNQGLSQILEMEKYDSLKQQFIALQMENKFDEMNELALGLQDVVEAELGTDLSVEVSPEKLEAYTTVGGVPHLDGEYTVFGRVVEGLEVIDSVAAQQAGRAGQPRQQLPMTMEIVKMSKSEVTEKYGYVYPN